MTTHGSATVRETPHETETTQITISDPPRRRAQAVINDRSVDPEWRMIIRYALEINDPWLADLVRRADAGETIVDAFESLRTHDADEAYSGEDKIEALAKMICQAGDECTAALFVLMGTLENSADPKLLMNTAKHIAVTRCVESNLYGIVDAQLAVVEGGLLAEHTRARI